MKYFIVLLIIVVISGSVYFFIKQDQQQDQPPIQWVEKIDDQPSVSISVLPLAAEQGSPFKIQVEFDTHSETLDFDVTNIATLVDKDGNLIQPLSWEGSEPGGHHRSGILVFPPLEPSASKFELKIRNVGGIPERNFQFP